MKNIKLALTFDDVLLVPQKSDVTPERINLGTNLTKNIVLNIPIVSAAMDTVTEYKLAIALAREGGIGFIHKNMSIAEQAQQVEMVKRSESGMINDPITLRAHQTLKDVERILDEHKISGLPVVDNSSKLLGIITNRDLKYLGASDKMVKDVMTKKNLITGHVGISLEQAKEILWAHRIEKLPIVDKNNKLVGLITSKDIENVLNYPYSCKDSRGRLRVGAAVGVAIDTLARVSALVKAGVDVICIDSAHGHSANIINTVKNVRKKFPKLDIVAGNVVTAKGAEDLVKAGANCVKIGIGPGSICTTRVIAGVGVPQISAIIEVAEKCKQLHVPCIADGGIKFSGDITKALAAGADCVMLGSLLAGCKESPGEEVIYQGKRFKTYVGMGSIAAMKRGSKDRYFQTNVNLGRKLVPEGIEGRVAYKGELTRTIFQLCGGIRSGMGYCGASNIKELKQKAEFVQITNAGLKESHPHDIEITTEAPNYTK